MNLRYRQLIKSVLIATLLLLFPMLVAHAETIAEDKAETIPVMPKVTVTGSQTDLQTTSATIDSELIEKLPSSNGTLSELLQTMPGVQFPEGANNSKTGGEIRPSEISISGGRVTDNNFLVDGNGINNVIDPNNTVETSNDIPAHSLNYFIPEHLIKDITVYRSNVPARYGGFSGGVVIANTKDPEPEFTGDITYKTTRSEWGQFYISHDDEEDFQNSTSSENQPDFTKHNIVGLTHIPINDDSAAFVSYSRIESSIPLILIDEKKVQYRRSENFFAKYNYEPSNTTKISITGSYAPYQADNHIQDTLNSDYRLESGGYIFTGKLNKKLSFGEIELKAGWDQSENSRYAPQDWKNWWNSTSKDWGEIIGDRFSKDGGYGNIKKEQSTLTGKINFDSKDITLGSINNKFNAGAEFKRAETTYDRLGTTTRYSFARLNDNVDCDGNSVDCIDGEQFFVFKNIFPKDSAQAEISNYDLYFDDNLTISRFSIRPGLRISYNDYQKNTDYAPRLAVSYDVLGNQNTVLIAGANRYYKTELLAHKLAEQKEPYQVWRRSTSLDSNNHPQEWTESQRSSIDTKRVSDLKTPYSDELTIGLKQKLWGGNLELLYIDRDYKNQLMAESLAKDDNGYIYQEFRNTGRRYHEQFSVSWERSWQKHYFSLNLAWQETKSNSLNYFDDFDPDLEEQLIWYEGKPIYRDKLLTSDFNRPYTANLIYAIELPKGFSFTNETRYTSRYRGVESTGEVQGYNGVDLEVYEDVSNPSAIVFDWKILWQSPEWKEKSIEVFVDILNVFNKKVTIGNDPDQFKLGRQYWAGLTYKF